MSRSAIEIQKRVKKPWKGDCEADAFWRSKVVNCRVKIRSRGRFLDLPLLLSDCSSPERKISRNSGSSVVTVYLPFLLDSSMTTCTLFLRFAIGLLPPVFLYGISMSLPSDAIAVVPRLGTSLISPLRSSLAWWAMSTLDVFGEGSGVQESSLPSGGLVERP